MTCGCEDFKVINNPDSPEEAFEVRGIGDLVFEKTAEPGKTVFIGRIEPYTTPQIVASDNPVREVGSTYDFTWNVNIVPGREPIGTRSITPALDPMPDLALPFNVEVLGQKRNNRSIVNHYAVQAGDIKGGVTSRMLSVAHVNKVYMGLSHKDGMSAGQVLNAGDIASFTGTLADNIKEVYGGLRPYILPASAVLKYIFWLYEVGTAPINSMLLSGLPFPLLFLPGSLTIANSHDNSLSANFVVVRSVNKFGAGSLSLDMK